MVMNFPDHWKSMTVPDRRLLADRCGTSHGFLQNSAYGYRECGPLLAVQLEQFTAGAVRRWDLRPNDWSKIWPELIGIDGAPPVPMVERAA